MRLRKIEIMGGGWGGGGLSTVEKRLLVKFGPGNWAINILLASRTPKIDENFSVCGVGNSGCMVLK